MVGIQFGGLASGIDSKALIERLLQLERLPIGRVEARKQGAQKKIDLVGTLRGLVESLRDKARALGTREGFYSFDVSSSDDTIATLSTTGDAVPGSHTLQVLSLASVDRWAFDAVSDPDLDLASADGQAISFGYDGVSYSVPLTASASSLNEIAGEIETITSNAVRATVINEGTTTTPSWRLVLTATDTGADHRISALTSNVAGLAIDGSAPDANGVAQSANNVTVGVNAVAVVDGLRIERTSNDFSDAVEGVSISLLSANAATTVAFTVEPDREAIRATLEDFVASYNAVIEFVNTQQRFDPEDEDGPNGALFGDPLLRTVVGTVRNTLFGQSAAAAAADTLGYGSLRLVGIETGADGKLSIDDEVFEAKLDQNLDAFADLFVDFDGFDNGGALPGAPGYYDDTTVDTGLGDDLARAIDRIVQPFNSGTGSFYAGLFEARTEALNSEKESYDRQIERMEREIGRLQESLTRRYAALESLIAQFQSQGASLGAFSA